MRVSRGEGHPAASIAMDFTVVPLGAVRKIVHEYLAFTHCRIKAGRVTAAPRVMTFIPMLKHAVSQTSGTPTQHGRVHAKHAFKHALRQGYGIST